MSYRQPAAASLETLVDYATAAIAGLQALPGLAEFAKPWLDLRQKLLAGRDARDVDRWALLGAQRKVQVLDAAWDAAIGDLSGRAFLAAGKDAGKPPYAQLFGTITATDAKKLGAAKATAFAGDVLAKGKAQAHPELAKSLEQLAAATTDLGNADAARAKARGQALSHEVARVALLEAVEKQTAETEVAILITFTGRSDLVRAVLAPERAEKKAANDEAMPEPQPV